MEFPTTTDHKRYHSLYHYNLLRYGGRVEKASLDAGCTCPNRDGTRGTGGCIFCRGLSHYFAGAGSITAQLEVERQRIYGKRTPVGLIAYFQAGTNTYGDLIHLRALWQEAIGFPEVLGLSIATRCDCLSDQVLDALGALRDQTDLTVELGLQTVHDRTAREIGRGHSFREFLHGYRALQSRGIRICVHLINGLPGESREEMLESARVLGQLRPGGVKLHLLHVEQGTALGERWASGGYVPMEKGDYVDLIVRQLELFPVETVIERLTGDGDRRYLLAPLWSRDKISVLGAIDHQMRREGISQGDRFRP